MTHTVVYDAPGEVRVEFDEEAREILATWTRFGNEAVFFANLDVQAELVESGRAKFILVDTENTEGLPSAKEQDYLVRHVFPRYREGGLEAIFTVVPRSARTKMGVKKWNHNGNLFRFSMYEVASLEDAREIIATRHAHALV